MLTSLRIQNFKAWKDTGEVPLAPLTVIFGSNSAGKSSIGHLLLALKQTALATDRKRALHLGDSNSLIDLGTLSDCLYGHDLNSILEFELKWKLPKALTVRDLHERTNTYSGNALSLKASLKAGKKEQPEIQGFEYGLRDEEKTVLDIQHKLNDGGKWTLGSASDAYRFVGQATGRRWDLSEPEKFYRVSETSISRYQNAGFLTDFALQTEQMLAAISYLGPLRDHPRRIYQWSGDTPEDVGQRGQSAVAAILAAQQDGRKLNRGWKRPTRAFAEFIAQWLIDMKVIHSFAVKPVAEGRKEFEVLIKTNAWSPEVKITDVGFGVSQVLPALVQAFYCAPNSTVWMEQPEIHLHPQVQSVLADVLISSVQAYQDFEARNVQLIVESHSEHFLTRLQRRIAEDVIKPSEVAVYFCRNTKDGAVLESLDLNLFGEIENWPTDFFGDQMGDLSARTIAAQRRKLHGEKV
jgi:predicted ATPase